MVEKNFDLESAKKIFVEQEEKLFKEKFLKKSFRDALYENLKEAVVRLTMAFAYFIFINYFYNIMTL